MTVAINPAWIAVLLSLIALIFTLKRDTRNATKEDIDALRRERDECAERLMMLEGQMSIVRDDNITLMKKLLGLEHKEFSNA